MGKTVRRRHNKDGSVTTTTSYSRKGLLGTRHVDTYVSKMPAPRQIKYSASAPKTFDPTKHKEQLQKELQNKYKRRICKSAFFFFAVSFGIAFVVPSFMLLNVLADVYDFSKFISHWIDYLKIAAVIIFPCMIIGATSQVIYVQRRRIWLEETDINTEQETVACKEELHQADKNQIIKSIQKAEDILAREDNNDGVANNIEHKNAHATEPPHDNEQICSDCNCQASITKNDDKGNDIMSIISKVATSNDAMNSIKTFQNNNQVNKTISTHRQRFNDNTIEKLKKRYISFDVETTGLNSYTDRIVEVGAVIFENMIPVKEYGSLVNAQKTISPQTTAINHITNEMIRNAPTEEQVYTELVNFLGDSLNAQTIICAHNADFDMGFLSKSLSRLGFNAEINYVDTLSVARELVPESPNHKLLTLANYFRIFVEQEHEAVSDAKVCGEILSKLIVLKQEEKERQLIQQEEQRKQEDVMQKMFQEYCDKRNQVSINPVHSRVPLDSIERTKKSDIEQDNGKKYWESGDILRKGGNIETAIEFFDKARYSGYCSPELYQSYAKAYRQLKDYDNEIDILDEAIYRFKNDRNAWEKFQTRRYKAVCLLIKKSEKNKPKVDKEEKDFINV